MNQDPRAIILKILDIIEYPENKEEFVNQFIIVCKKQAVTDLISNLSPEKQEQLKNSLSTQNKDEEIALIFKDFFSDSDYEHALEKATENTLRKLLESILPDLSSDQRKILKELISSLPPMTH
jgi:hypothetical protein